MDYSRLEGIEKALLAFEANVSPRYRYLDCLERWVEGRQYEGLTDWFDTRKPLFERAPCIVYLLTRGSIESKRDLVVGEGHFPEITASPDEDDEDFDEETGLGPEDSETLDRFVQRAMTKAAFAPAIRESLEHGQGVGSAVLLFGARKGRPFIETTKAKWSEPTLDNEGNCTRLEIRYPYLDPYKDKAGKWKVRAKIYRRVIDETTDTTYRPADADEQGREPAWSANPELTYSHGLGFCPVIWYPFAKGCSTANQIDGKAVHDGLLDEIRALDQALSQRHRAVLFTADPQWTECGVVPGSNPSSVGNRAVMPATQHGGPEGPDNKGTGMYIEPGNIGPARKKGPGEVWQYPDKDTKVQMHCLPGDAVKATMEHSSDLRLKLCELLAYVPLDPESIKGIRTLSGKALTALRKREINRCNGIRDDLGQHCIIPAIRMLLRLCVVLGSRGKGAIRVPGIQKTLPILQRFLEEDPDLRLIWGSYEDEDPEEEKATVDTVNVALTGKFITKRMAVQKVKNIFGIENVDQAVDMLEEEAQQAQEKELDLMGSMHKLANDDGTTGNQGSSGSNALGGKPPKKAFGGGNKSMATSPPK
ncbi:MAG: hypothetical protein WC551_07570 [Patescibacteria group bacterium]